MAEPQGVNSAMLASMSKSNSRPAAAASMTDSSAFDGEKSANGGMSNQESSEFLLATDGEGMSSSIGGESIMGQALAGSRVDFGFSSLNDAWRSAGSFAKSIFSFIDEGPNLQFCKLSQAAVLENTNFTGAMGLSEATSFQNNTNAKIATMFSKSEGAPQIMG